MAWIDARDPATQRLLFRFDPQRELIESVCSYWDEAIKKRIRYKVVTDLGPLRDKQPPPLPRAPDAPMVAASTAAPGAPLPLWSVTDAPLSATCAAESSPNGVSEVSP